MAKIATTMNVSMGIIAQAWWFQVLVLRSRLVWHLPASSIRKIILLERLLSIPKKITSNDINTKSSLVYEVASLCTMASYHIGYFAAGRTQSVLLRGREAFRFDDGYDSLYTNNYYYLFRLKKSIFNCSKAGFDGCLIRSSDGNEDIYCYSIPLSSMSCGGFLGYAGYPSHIAMLIFYHPTHACIDNGIWVRYLSLSFLLFLFRMPCSSLIWYIQTLGFHHISSSVLSSF